MGTDIRKGLGAAALILLCASAVPLAAPGEALVPGSIDGAPGWLLGPYGDGLGVGGGTYLAAMIAAFVAYLGMVLWSGSLGRSVVWGAIVVLVAAFALAPPLLSLDVFSYMSYARLGADHGLNPYHAVPADLVADPAGDRVEDFRSAVSAYGPLFTLATYPLGVTSVAFALWALKAAAALAVLGVAGLTARLASVRGASPRAAATFVALNPLVLVHVVGGAHNDALMALVLVACAVALVAGLDASAGGGLVAAAALKAAGVFAAPFALLGAKRRARLLTGAAVALAAVVAVGLAVFGGDVANAIGVVGENQSTASHYSVPSTVARIAGIGIDPVRAVFGVAYAALIGWLLVWTLRGGDWLRAAAWAGAGLLAASAWLVPWYVIWALPFAAVARDRAVALLVVAICALQLPTAIP